jgi:hypothetical protein
MTSISSFPVSNFHPGLPKRSLQTATSSSRPEAQAIHFGAKKLPLGKTLLAAVLLASGPILGAFASSSQPAQAATDSPAQVMELKRPSGLTVRFEDTPNPTSRYFDACLGAAEAVDNRLARDRQSPAEFTVHCVNGDDWLSRQGQPFILKRPSGLTVRFEDAQPPTSRYFEACMGAADGVDNRLSGSMLPPDQFTLHCVNGDDWVSQQQ